MIDELDEAYLYHYERAQSELAIAEQGDGRAADIHRELAALHLAQKQHVDFLERLARGQPRPLPMRIDKES